LIGFIGLGAMGAVMATRLLAAGRGVVVYDVRAEAVDALVAEGAIAAKTPREVADSAETVLLSLPSPAVAVEVITGEDGVLAGGQVQYVVDTSTIGGPATGQLAAAAAAHGVGYVDAPVTGGVRGAVAGTLTVMVAGADPAVDHVSPLLGIIGSTLVRVGRQPGQAQVAKLANNLLSASAILLSAEAVLMAVKAGIDPAVVTQIMSQGTGRNSAVEEKFPKFVMTRTFDSQFRLDLLAKDLRLCLAAAAEMNVPMLAGRQVEQMFSLCESLSAPGADSMEMVRLLEGWSGVQMDDSSWRQQLPRMVEGH
jgi:3-hydroxyisobutyrate dehydrogenase-like beta-hydroxyacid dehydrogenase